MKAYDMANKTNSEYTQDDKENYFEEVPISIVRDLEQYEFAGAKRIHGGQCHSRHEGAKEAPPHSLDAESVAHFLGRRRVRFLERNLKTHLYRKEDPTDG